MPRRGSPADARNRTDGRGACEIVVSEGTPRNTSAPAPPIGMCEVCCTQTTQRCNRCHVSHYCSAACQKASWMRGHQAACDAMCDHVHHALIRAVQQVAAAHDKGRCLRFIMLRKQTSTRHALDTLEAVKEAVTLHPVFTPFSMLLISVVQKRSDKEATVMMCRAGGMGSAGRLPYINLYSLLMTNAQMRQAEWRKACAAAEGTKFFSGDCALLIGCVCQTEDGAVRLRVDKYEYQMGLRGGRMNTPYAAQAVDYRFTCAPVEDQPYAMFALESTGDGVRLAADREPMPEGTPPVAQHFAPTMLFELINELNTESATLDAESDEVTAAVVRDHHDAARERGMPDCEDAYEARRRGKELVKAELATCKERHAAGDTSDEVRMFGDPNDPEPFPAGSQEAAMAKIRLARQAVAPGDRPSNINGLDAVLGTIQALNLNVRLRPDLE